MYPKDLRSHPGWVPETDAPRTYPTRLAGPVCAQQDPGWFVRERIERNAQHDCTKPFCFVLSAIRNSPHGLTRSITANRFRLVAQVFAVPTGLRPLPKPVGLGTHRSHARNSSPPWGRGGARRGKVMNRKGKWGNSQTGVAPQSGHVSNFCWPTGIVIEPVNPVFFQEHRLVESSIVHDGHPAWTRLELTVLDPGRRNNRIAQPPRGPAVWAGSHG